MMYQKNANYVQCISIKIHFVEEEKGGCHIEFVPIDFVLQSPPFLFVFCFALHDWKNESHTRALFFN
jgi:hypothetical protein